MKAVGGNILGPPRQDPTCLLFQSFKAAVSMLARQALKLTTPPKYLSPDWSFDMSKKRSLE